MAFNNKNGIYEAMSLPDSGLDVSYPSSSSETPTSTSGGNSQPGSSSFESMDRQSVAGTNTLKRNPKMELSKTDLLRLLSYMEGELQAQNIVIAALKSERVKHEVTMGRYKPAALNDPLAALSRDGIVESGGQNMVHNNQELSSLADQQLEALDNLVIQQRRMQIRMANILKDAEEKHQKVIQELEEEKRKHEHDTAQGDDITYGLEMERTRLKQELELEKQAKKRNEKDQKKFQESVEDERSRQKQIVLLLLAERKKIIIRYIEERKRSEDLAQILSEEKTRIDAMAEGLEEESKKSLRSEAELEKHLQQCEKEKVVLRAKITADEQKIKELETELQMYKQMVCAGKSAETVISQSALPSKGVEVCGVVGVASLETSGIPSSVAKVMQPTSTVSSVPVSGPTTGIAQTIHSAQAQVVARPVAVPVKQQAAFPARVQLPVAAAVAQPGVVATPSSPAPVVTHPYLKKGAVLSRGVPPPIPPNKPVVLPKRETADRKLSVGAATAAAAPATPVVATGVASRGLGAAQRVAPGAADSPS